MKRTTERNDAKTFTLGDRGENHVGNQIIGNSASCGFSIADIGKTDVHIFCFVFLSSLNL